MQKYASQLKMYGAMTNIVTYADRTATIGFALGDMEMPTRRKKIILCDKGAFVGFLHPVHNIRLLGGVPCCNYCPAILVATKTHPKIQHTEGCEDAKKEAHLYMARKKKLGAQAAEKAKASGIVVTAPRGGRGQGRARQEVGRQAQDFSAVLASRQ